MQVSIETTSELSRKMTVHVPEEKIQEQVDIRLRSMVGKVKIDGFRPGKVPHSIIQKRYGQGIRDEVVVDLIQSSFNQAVREENLKLVSDPTIMPEASTVGKGLRYVADFEVIPDFVLYPLELLEVDRLVSEVTEDDVENMLITLREQRKNWELTDLPAALGHRVTVFFEGKVDGESITSGKMENIPVVIGSNQIYPGFEEKLIGATTGSSLSFTLEFPEGYGGEKLSGKSGEFKVEVVKIEVGIVPELDEVFLSNFGIEDGDIQVFRAEIKTSMEREMRRYLNAKNKNSVIEELLKKNDLPNLPTVLVNQELERLVSVYNDEAKKLNLPFDESSTSPRLEDAARKRVTLGLLLSKIIETNQLRIDPARVRSAIEDLAKSYEDPDEVVKWYYSDKDQLAQVQGMVIEDQVVDLIFERAKIQEKTIGLKELMLQSQAQQANQA